ncbi:DUF2235 domain-containing protein [Seongchinamella sediminis]|uniref:DUF2235 domain-containing protein n=1 Tax=Seongchinamella sediminis TaxID=2283635 RepID=A0A3L7DXK6_9GAMM|nr:DUF2235 domain-containing protein [Seongchinamella sediminis]RLQ21329.1 DUF2235 domain-containing protein [Seongchinamella sediminis]
MEAENKRIVVCADGTWNDPEDEHPTNVLRVARAVSPVADDGRKQVVFYDWGVGSYYATVRGGAAGLGIMKNIQDGYRFIVQNYHPGDEIFLFGFSRGAYTVRCLCGMLNNCGVVTRQHAERIPEAFDFYKNSKARPGSREARDWRRKYSHGPDRGTVDFIGVWDTVGALGVPTRVLAFMDERDLFFDRDIGSNVRVARHAVSIDERRADFKPTLWGDKSAVDIRQVWFAGVHADVGGGYGPDKGGKMLSDIPLAWMAGQATAAGLQLEPHLVRKSALDTSAAKHRSYKSYWKVLGREQREIPDSAILHRSVFRRYESGEDQPPPLRDWLQRRQGDWGQLEN